MNPTVVAAAGSVLLTVAAVSGCAAEKHTATETTTTSTPAAVSTTSPSTTPSSSTPMVGGMTECTKEALAKPASEAATALGPKNVYSIDTLSCSNGWAVTAGILSSSDNPGMGAPTSFVFEQEGQFWIPKEKAAVCGTNPVSTTAPADAEIPADLFLAGCAAG